MNINRLIIFACVSLFLIGCNKEINIKKEASILETNHLLENEYIIKGQTFNDNLSIVYLYSVSNDSLILIDTSSVVNNTFVFKGVIANPAYFSIKTNASDNAFKFLADASAIDLLLHDDLGYSTTYSNSDIQRKYKEYGAKMTSFKTKGVDLYYNLKGDFSKANIDKLKLQRAKLFKKQSDYIADFISKNPESYFSSMLLEDNLQYFPATKLRTLYDGLSSNLKEQDFTKSINITIAELEATEKEKLKIQSTTSSKPNASGEYRPNAYAFNGLNPDGHNMSLESIPHGKVVLLDFWASWCVPCRADSPNLVQLHNKYKDRGLVIMSVSEDKGEGEWISAIYTDNLSWNYHIMDKNKSIAFRYGVESIPHKVLIDKNGKIANGKISGSALERRIQQLLAE